jgi:hypothetical protein
MISSTMPIPAVTAKPRIARRPARPDRAAPMYSFMCTVRTSTRVSRKCAGQAGIHHEVKTPGVPNTA